MCFFILLSTALGILLIGLGLFGTVGEEASSEWTLFLGRFHPLILHLPIGAVCVVALMEICRLCSRGRWAGDVLPALGLAAFTAVIAVFSGFLLGQDTGYGEELLNEHFLWGVGFGVALCFAFACKLFAAGRFVANIGYGFFLILSLIVMLVAGHHGASLTHGETYLTDKAPDSVREIFGLPENSNRVAELAAEERGKPLSEQNFYVAHIAPTLESKCYQCHNDGKQKGQLNMVGMENMLVGGKNGPLFIAGNVDESQMVERILLPEEDEHHMPPSGKPQVSTDELELLKAWIAAGVPSEALVAEIELPSDLLEAMAAGLDASAMEERSIPEMLPEATYTELQQELTSMRERFPGAISLLSRSGDALYFNASALNEFSTADLEALTPYASRWVKMNLSGENLTGDSLALLSGFNALESLLLNGQPIGSDAIRQIENLESLASLSLYGTSVDDQVIEALDKFPALKKVYLSKTNLSESGIQSLPADGRLEIIFEARP